ncbi:hypothetical protein [Aquimarina agarivorans]|uniref:hypothetical protein n=1 Tax=Aquimarina agarivorans TaxID=980584 RepID=UPI000248ED5F|nr:hypothetical protein [Aquimarina agarivorans]
MHNHLLKYNPALVLLTGFLLSCSSSESESMPKTPGTVSSLNSVEFNQNWIKNLGGSLNDEIKSITLSKEDYILLGNTESIDGDVNRATGTQDFWVVKINAAGEIIWNKTFGGTDDDRGESISKTSDGGFIVSGYSRSTDGDVSNNKGSYDHWIIKLNADGDLVWENSFGFLGDDRAFSAIETSDGGFATAGFLDVDNYVGPNLKPNENPENGAKIAKSRHGVGEFWIHKLNKNGIKEWEKFFGGSNNDRASDIVAMPNGGFIAVGSTESTDFDISNNKGSYDFWAVRIDDTGALVWEKTYGGSGIDMANAIIKTSNDNYIIVGDSRSSDFDVPDNKGNADIWVIKIDANGALLGQTTIGGTEFETAKAIFETNTGNFLISGNTRSNNGDVTDNSGENDIYLGEIDQNLKLQWATTFGGTQLDFATDVLQDDAKNIIVVGDSESASDTLKNKGRKDAFVISLSEKN